MALGHRGLAGMDLRWIGHAPLHAGRAAIRGSVARRAEHNRLPCGALRFYYPGRISPGLGVRRRIFWPAWRPVGALARAEPYRADLCPLYRAFVLCAIV